VLPEDFTTLCGDDLFDPFADAQDPVCTLCPDNTMRSDDGDWTLVDHVLVRGLEVESLDRIMTDTVSVDVEGTVTETNYSVHYGLRVTLW